MAKVRINKTAVRSKILKGAKRKGGEKKIYTKVNSIFQKKKKEMVSNFENHPITKEISAGAAASNISGTLGGYGNLFTFIGFDKGSSPTRAIASMLRADTRLVRKPSINSAGKRIHYMYRIKYPSMMELGSVAPMPWEPGNWVQKIEKGISGLGNYIYHNYMVPTSRSGKGTQSGSNIRGGMYTRTKYMSAILKTFKTGWGRL